MSLSTSFEGDPESCRRTAERLGSLALALEDAAAYAATQAATSPDTFDGWAADAYRVNASRLQARTTRSGAACRGLASALGAFATTLEGVRLALRRTRGLARQHLVVDGEDVLRPGPYATDVQRRVFDLVEHAVGEARRLEHQAHRDWQAALAEHAGTAPVPPAAVPVGEPVVPPAVRPSGTRPEPPPDATAPPPAAGGADPAVAPAVAPVAVGAGLLTAAVGASRAREVDLVLVPPPDDDWAAPARPVGAPVPWEVPDGPR